MCGVTATSTVERPLIRSVFAVYVIAHMTFLRRIRTLDLCCSYPALGGIPGNLVGNMTKIGGTHIGIHRSRFVAHGGHGKLLIGNLAAFVLKKTPIDGP